VIGSAGQPEGQPDQKKPTALRGEVGVWNRESGDRIKGCDGACVHAVSSLARAASWSITNFTAFTSSGTLFQTPQWRLPGRSSGGSFTSNPNFGGDDSFRVSSSR